VRQRLRGDRERGSSAVELLGVMPVVVVVILVVLQVCAAAYATQATNQAARDGARALSRAQSVPAAVERSLPGGLTAESLTYPGGDGVRLVVRVPRVAIFPPFTVTREAVMP